MENQGQVIQAAREKRGWSRRQFAFKAGINQKTVRVVEEELASPSVATLAKIEQALEWEPGTLTVGATERRKRAS